MKSSVWLECPLQPSTSTLMSTNGFFAELVAWQSSTLRSPLAAAAAVHSSVVTNADLVDFSGGAELEAEQEQSSARSGNTIEDRFMFPPIPPVRGFEDVSGSGQS